ncbi:MAG: proteasome accessory factor PafA2 family protein [Armatimonadetes bacterium]|nr:proteasome accessory factor PafA2 family protein [Armatimonadota bacterium]
MALVSSARTIISSNSSSSPWCSRGLIVRLCGIETEHGIYVEGKEAKDLINESMAVVRAYPGPHGKPWDYKGEDPRRDARGFRAERLFRSAASPRHFACKSSRDRPSSWIFS